jgi:FMN reductase
VRQRSIAVVSAGLTQPSSSRLLADRLAAAATHELELLRVRPEVHTIEVRDHAHDVVNAMLTGFPAAGLKAAVDAVAGADGLIAVTPIFNASYSGLFKSFFDVVGDSAVADKPVLIAATGGTMRHSLALEHALRPLFAYLRAVVVPTSVFAASEDWAGDGAGSTLRERVARAARELAEAVQRREPAAVADPFALTSSFEDLLGA